MLERPAQPRRRSRVRRNVALAAFAVLLLAFSAPAVASTPPVGEKDGLDVQSLGLALAHQLQGNPKLNGLTPSFGGVINTGPSHSQANHQVNDPLLDNIQTPGGQLFQFATESETSIVQSGGNLVAAYNSSAGTKVADAQGDLSQVLISAFSYSRDGGKTWTSGFLPPIPGSIATLGDPALATDRSGNVYYASLGFDAGFNVTIDVNKSTNHGVTWSAAKALAVDNGGDKDWIAAGPDPTAPSRDNVYVTWTSFSDTGSSLWLARSTNGGATWSAKKIFQPTATTALSSYVTFSNPVVDQSTGRLYIPYLHFSNSDADFIEVLVSDDGGKTFSSLHFNVPGAPETTGFPNVTPGALEDCGAGGGIRTAIHEGKVLGGASTGLPRWVQSTRTISQPSAAAVNGRLFIALNSSSSPVFGAGTGSYIRVLYSPDGGATWAAPVTVAPSTASDPQHIHPAITVDGNGGLHVVYYTQDAAGRVRVEAAKGAVQGNTLAFAKPSHVSVPSDLTPSNIPLTPDETVNFDSLIVPCYDLGEYLSVAPSSFGAVAAWGDNRALWKEAKGSLIQGVHNQADVFSDLVP